MIGHLRSVHVCVFACSCGRPLPWLRRKADLPPLRVGSTGVVSQSVGGGAPLVVVCGGKHAATTTDLTRVEGQVTQGGRKQQIEHAATKAGRQLSINWSTQAVPGAVLRPPPRHCGVVVGGGWTPRLRVAGGGGGWGARSPADHMGYAVACRSSLCLRLHHGTGRCRSMPSRHRCRCSGAAGEIKGLGQA